MTSRLVPVAALALLALVAVPAAFAHGGDSRGFKSRVTAIVPPVAGVSVDVLDGDDRLRLTNGSPRTVVVLGYEGEQYLRFDAGGGVWENRRSPAVYENVERYGVAELPAEADAKAKPDWRRVAAGRAYEWHDHRAHWMSPILPPRVRAEPDSPHHVFGWRVPLRAEGRRLAIRGTLTYAPPPDEVNRTLIAATALVGVAALGTTGVLVRRRRRR